MSERRASVVAEIDNVAAEIDKTLCGDHRSSALSDAASRPQVTRAMTPSFGPGGNGAFKQPMHRALTPIGSRISYHVHPEDEQEMKVRFNSERHQQLSAAILLGNTPKPRPLTQLVRRQPSDHVIRRTRASDDEPRHLPVAVGNEAPDDICSSPHRGAASSGKPSSASPRPRTVAVEAGDVAVLCRLAAVQSDHPVAKRQEQLRHALPMRHLDLRWIYEVDRRPNVAVVEPILELQALPACDATQSRPTSGRSRASVTSSRSRRSIRSVAGKPPAPSGWYSLEVVANMIEGTTSTDDRDRMVLNSPRTVLTLLRDGVDPKHLLPVDEDAVTKELSIAGLRGPTLRARLEFLRQQREVALAGTVARYEDLCRSIDRQTLLAFIDAFIDSDCDYSHLPHLVPQREGPGGYEVQMPTDDKVTDAILAIKAKNAREQHNVQTRLRMELEIRDRVAAMRDERAAETMQVAVRRHAAAEARRLDRKQETQLRDLLQEERACIRAEGRMAAAAKLEEERSHRDQVAAQLDAASRAAVAKRTAARRQRMDEKRLKREAKSTEAAANAAQQEAQRLRKIADADAFHTEQQAIRERERAAKAAELVLRQSELEERRQEVVARATAAAEAKREAAEQKQREADAALERFKETKEVTRQIRGLLDMKKALRREGVADGAERRAIAAREAIEIAGEAQRHRFDAFRAHVEEKRDDVAERARESNLAKHDYVAQQGRAQEFSRLGLENNLAAKTTAANVLANSRAQIAIEAAAARSRLSVNRRAQLLQADEETVEAERGAFFRLLNTQRGPDAAEGRHKRQAAASGSVAAQPSALQDAKAECPLPLEVPQDSVM
jgi:hypothetical protein